MHCILIFSSLCSQKKKKKNLEIKYVFFFILQTSAVEISQIMYLNISGTSKTAEAMKFACSDTVPCNNIILNNINLQRMDGKTAQTYCNSVTGINYGLIEPSADCLTSSSDKSTSEECEVHESEHLMHTEL
ncbi:putative endo-polygalacturonase [Helianthus debilis subsp. tardiflorus]